MSDLIVAECSTVNRRKARKSHKCCECKKIINKGEKYQFVSGIWEGEPNSYKTCLSCVELRENFEESNGQAGFGFLAESISECILYRDYSARDFANENPEIKPNIEKLFNLDGGKCE